MAGLAETNFVVFLTGTCFIHGSSLLTNSRRVTLVCNCRHTWPVMCRFIVTMIGAMSFLVQAFVFDKSYRGELVFVVCVFRGKDSVRGEECSSLG